MSKFKAKQFITHRNKCVYFIVKEPGETLLEYCNEPFYEYENVATGQAYVRRQSEMEDGRFELIEQGYL